MEVEVHGLAALLGAAPQLAVAVHPGVRALYHPAFPSLDRDRDAFAGDLGGEAQLGQQDTGVGAVVAAVQVDVDASGIAQTWARAAFSVGPSRVESCRLAPSETMPSGMPQASEATERFSPCLPRSTGDRPAFSPPDGALVMQPSTEISGGRHRLAGAGSAESHPRVCHKTSSRAAAAAASGEPDTSAQVRARHFPWGPGARRPGPPRISCSG